MSANLAAILYLVSGALFIMALRGLSSPATSRQGNMYGMVGMAIAMVTTLATMQLSPVVIGLVVLGLAIGGGIGAVMAKKIAMTAMPQLVAAFHSLVGLAAVFVAAAAFYAPEAFHIVVDGMIQPISRIEMSLGAAIGAITFTGSIIAFLTFGPMVDIKSSLMFLGVFQRRTVLYLILLPALLTLFIGVFWNLNIGL